MLDITPVGTHNEAVYAKLAQNYEAEFSRLTRKRPNAEGLYEYTRCDASHDGYLLWHEGKPIGFIVVDTSRRCFDVAEFYIIPSERRGGHGRALAHWAFTRYPGNWQVRQIVGADWAHAFWVDVIAEFSSGHFTDEKENDPEWGIVDIQRFSSQNNGIKYKLENSATENRRPTSPEYTAAKELNHEFVATHVWFSKDKLHVALDDGREISVPLEFYPRLNAATREQRDKFEIIGLGTAIHWNEIDEDLSVEGIVLGIPARF